MEEEEQDVKCIDDVTGKEMPCHAVRKALEQEQMYLRDFGVYEKGKRCTSTQRRRERSWATEVR